MWRQETLGGQLLAARTFDPGGVCIPTSLPFSTCDTRARDSARDSYPEPATSGTYDKGGADEVLGR